MAPRRDEGATAMVGAEDPKTRQSLRILTPKSFRVAEKGWPEGDTGVGKGGTGGGKGDEFRTLSIY